MIIDPRLQEQITSIPATREGDMYLAQLSQNASNPTLQFLAGLEVNNRANARQQAMAAQAAQQQGIGSVPVVAQKAQELMTSDAGIDNLPIPESMYDEQAMAGGGIVAFEDGGAVQSPGYFTRGLAALGDVATVVPRAFLGALNHTVGGGIPDIPGGDNYQSMTPFYDKYVRGPDAEVQARLDQEKKDKAATAPTIEGAKQVAEDIEAADKKRRTTATDILGKGESTEDYIKEIKKLMPEGKAMEKTEASLAKMKDEGFNEFLITLGTTMATTPGSPLNALAVGAKAAAPRIAELNKEIRKTEREIEKARRDEDLKVLDKAIEKHTKLTDRRMQVEGTLAAAQIQADAVSGRQNNAAIIASADKKFKELMRVNEHLIMQDPTLPQKLQEQAMQWAMNNAASVGMIGGRLPATAGMSPERAAAFGKPVKVSD